MIQVSQNIFRLVSLAKTTAPITNQAVLACFSSDKTWKERDEASERVYISKQ